MKPVAHKDDDLFDPGLSAWDAPTLFMPVISPPLVTGKEKSMELDRCKVCDHRMEYGGDWRFFPISIYWKYTLVAETMCNGCYYWALDFLGMPDEVSDAD